MRKLTLLLAVLALAAVPSVADAAKKKKTAAAQPAATQQARPQMAPGESAVRVIAGGARELSRIGQPPPAAKGKK
jgi:hypothetical protein